jgi:alanine racemase
MINLNDLLKSANGQLFGEPTAQLFTEFIFDAAQVRPNTMFVAMRTSRGDTHDDIAEAITNGASGILCHEPPTVDTTGITVVIVRDSLDTLMHWSRFVLGRMGARIIGVGGTHGRSVAVRAIAKVLSYKYSVHEGELELEGLLSLPTTVARLKPDTRYVVLKLAPNAPGEMAELVQACQPSIAVINHMDTLPTLAFKNEAQIISEHMTLLNSLAPGDLAIVNFDDDVAREMGSQSRAQVRTVAIDTFGADMMALNIIAGADRTGFDIRYENEREVGRWSPILGRHHLIDLLSALLLGIELGVPMRDGLRALSQLSHVSGRMRPLNGRNGSLLIDDSYQANLSDTLAALEWLAEVRAEGRRTIFVMGDLDNLGSSSAFAHRTIGARAASLVDHIVTLGTDAALVGRSAIDTEMPARQIRTTYGVQDAINTINDMMLTSDDVVLVKGGSGMRMEAVVKGLLENASDAQLLVRQNENALLTETSLRSLRPSWKEIDGDALARNIRVIRGTLGSDVTMMAVVKANGYGHGAVLTARTALANGAEYLGVANMAEALELREAGLTAPILVLTYLPVQAVRQAISENITATVFDLNIAQQYDRAARSSQSKLKVHVKIDTGMGRLGILASDAINVFRHLNSLRNLEIEGVFTHFASADDNREFTQTQLDTFRQITKFLKAGGFNIRYFHAANSPATVLGDDFHFNMVRVGLMMYGLNPSKLAGLPSGVQPVMSWKTNILQVKQLPPGHSVGYGRTYITKGDETIAILPVGYADGLRRSPYTWKEVLVRGKRVPLVGRVSMEKCAINVTGVPDVSPGDEVVLLGRQGYDRISAEEVGLWIGSINYEVTTTILPRG